MSERQRETQRETETERWGKREGRRENERDRECVYVCVREREREIWGVCCVCRGDRERKYVCGGGGGSARALQYCALFTLHQVTVFLLAE